MVVYGIRTYILEQMRGRRVGGSVQWICTEDYGQCIRLKCACNVETHGIIAKFLEDTDFWNWQHYGTEVVNTMSEKFSIIDSTRNTICGTKANTLPIFFRTNPLNASSYSATSHLFEDVCTNSMKHHVLWGIDTVYYVNPLIEVNRTCNLFLFSVICVHANKIYYALVSCSNNDND